MLLRYPPYVFLGGALALGESYMDGWWDCEALDQFFYKAFIARINAQIIPFSHKLLLIKSRVFNRQNKRRAREGRREGSRTGRTCAFSLLSCCLKEKSSGRRPHARGVTAET